MGKALRNDGDTIGDSRLLGMPAPTISERPYVAKSENGHVLAALEIPEIEAGKTGRVNFRLPASAKATIEYAAALKGLSLTDYILSNMLEVARADVHAIMNRRLSERDTEKLLRILESDPGEPSERMRQAADNYNRLIAGVE